MHKRRSWLGKLLAPALRRARQFGRDERGVTVIEFAFLALPFFTIVAATLETSLVFLGGQVLDSAVDGASRLVSTGQAQTAGYTDTDFRKAICDGLYGMFTCSDTSKLRINVSVVSGFDAATMGYPLDTGTKCTATKCDWTLAEGYSAGVGSDVVLVQVYYKWPTVVNLPGFNFQTLPDGTRLLGASRVFRNEPFACSDCT